MEIQEDFKKISRLLEYTGRSNISEKEVCKSEITRYFLSIDPEPGVNIRYLEQLDNSGWTEWNVLFEVTKYKNTSEYLSYVFKTIAKYISGIPKTPEIDSIGIQEVSLSQAGYAYVLIYILSDGKRNETRKHSDNR